MGITTATTRVWPTTKQVNRVFVISRAKALGSPNHKTTKNY